MKTWSYLLAPFAAWLAAGCLKFAINSLRAGKPAFGLIGYGGMPSNHSAIVSSMAALTALREGLDSAAFGVALTLAFIVMLDAASLRRQVGRHAQALNERGFYYQREKNWQAAAADFEQATEFSQWIEDPATRQKMYGAAQRGLGFTLIERGRWQDAEAIYQKLLQENPHDDRARNELEYIRQQRAKHPAL